MDGSVCDWSARVEEASRRLPIIGAPCLTRLLDNLGAADLDLPVGAAARLDTATRVDLGFPATFIRDTSPSGRRRSRRGQLTTPGVLMPGLPGG